MAAGKITYATLMADEGIHPPYEKALESVRSEFGQHHPIYVGEREVKASEEFEDRSPIDTNILLGYFQKGTAEHFRGAISEANRAFPEWARRAWKERVEVMIRASDLFSKELYRLAALLTYEVGKNRFEAIAEVWEVVEAIHYHADLMKQNDGYIRPMAPGAPGEQTRSVLKPHGAWVVISPFNFPIMLASSMTVGALMTGNTVVLKPTSQSPLSSLQLYKLLRGGGVPAGVINFVTGPGGELESALANNQEVAGIAFTGSKDVGMKLFKSFLTQQPYPKPFICEMGSKNPAIITAKADLDKAVEGVVRAAFGFGGQKCSAASRVYVQEGVLEPFLRKIQERTGQIRTGDPRQRDVFLGPVVNRKAQQDYQAAVELIRKEGGKILVGGQVARDGPLERGYYVTPTVATSLPHSHRFFKEELFLPILLVDTYKSLNEALTKANDTEFGLTAGIFSEDPVEIQEFLDRIHFGVIYANRRGGATTGAWPGAQPFGGWKASSSTGKGVGGPYYLTQFLREQAQTVVEEPKK